MQDDVITIRLRLPELVVVGVKETKGWIEVVARYRREEAVCPRCGVGTWQVHQWHLQRKRDAKLWGKEVWVAVLKRRFRCRCYRKVFMEPDPVCGSSRRAPPPRHSSQRRECGRSRYGDHHSGSPEGVNGAMLLAAAVSTLQPLLGDDEPHDSVGRADDS